MGLVIPRGSEGRGGSIQGWGYSCPNEPCRLNHFKTLRTPFSSKLLFVLVPKKHACFAFYRRHMHRQRDHATPMVLFCNIIATHTTPTPQHKCHPPPLGPHATPMGTYTAESAPMPPTPLSGSGERQGLKQRMNPVHENVSLSRVAQTKQWHVCRASHQTVNEIGQTAKRTNGHINKLASKLTHTHKHGHTSKHTNIQTDRCMPTSSKQHQNAYLRQPTS